MNKKIIFLICAIGIALLSINYICALGDMNSSDWVNVTVDDVNFKIPQEFAGGDVRDSSYSLENMFEFGLLSLKDNKNLKNNYGYESTYEDVYNVEEMEIDGHHAVAYYSDRKIVNHNVTYLFFETNGTVFALSYNGNDVNSTMKEIVSSTPKSKWTKEKFDEKLNKAQEDYIEAQNEYEREYEIEEAYRSGYNQGKSDRKARDLIGYYVFYKLGQRSR